MSHVRYMDRIRDYYLSQGYEKPYVWAHFDDVPFAPLQKPLSESVVTLFSTSDVSLRQDDGSEMPDEALSSEETTVGNVYSLPWDTPTDRLYSRQQSFDRYATSLDDVDSYLPLTHLRAFAEAGRIGAVTRDFHNINRGYSQKLMTGTAAPMALAKCRAEGADVAVLTPV
jgi:D-proline reductase (dithiol) PrdB